MRMAGNHEVDPRGKLGIGSVRIVGEHDTDGYLELSTKKKSEMTKTVQQKTQIRPFSRIVAKVIVKTIGAIKSTNNMTIGVLRIASFMVSSVVANVRDPLGRLLERIVAERESARVCGIIST
jgi:hypothetical protein